VISRPKRTGPQVTVGILSVLAAVALAVLLGWLAVHFAVKLTGTFEVIAAIVSWILWPGLI
jgi:hypothetical protein